MLYVTKVAQMKWAKFSVVHNLAPSAQLCLHMSMVLYGLVFAYYALSCLVPWDVESLQKGTSLTSSMSPTSMTADAKEVK